MDLRERYEQFEIDNLAPQAAKSKFSKGREHEDTVCDLRTVYQRDRDRIIYSKAFRRLKHKTQVFLSPEGDHYRTRLTHTLEVSQISRTIARAMNLNEDLTEAIALGHDLGHTPFGHTGERTLDRLLESGFRHNEQSLRTVDLLEVRNGHYGLNLTYEVRDGILNHPLGNRASTLEGRIVSIADRIAYINHDIDDAQRAGIITAEQIPDKYLRVLGYSHGKRIDTMIKDIIETSTDSDEIKMSPEVAQCTSELRQFLFENIYFNKIAKSEDEKANFILEKIFEYYEKNFHRLTEFYLTIYEKNNFTQKEIIKDYIAGMTDRFAMKSFEDIYMPRPWGK